MATILADTREIKMLPFKPDSVFTDIERVALTVGDYSCRFLDGSTSPVVFERKSLPDLFGTMTKGYSRFRREVIKAKELRLVLILIIEGSLSEVYQGLPYSKFSGDSCIQKLFTLWLKYDLMPVFCTSRVEMMAFIKETFEAVGRMKVVERKIKPEVVTA